MTDTDGNGHEEREEPEMPIVLMRSAPVELHFSHQGQDEASGRVRIATYLRTGLLARTTMDAEQFYVLRRSNAAREPVRITGLACCSGPGEALLLMLQVEAREDLWLFESEPLEFKLEPPAAEPLEPEPRPSTVGTRTPAVKEANYQQPVKDPGTEKAKYTTTKEPDTKWTSSKRSDAGNESHPNPPAAGTDRPASGWKGVQR